MAGIGRNQPELTEIGRSLPKIGPDQPESAEIGPKLSSDLEWLSENRDIFMKMSRGWATNWLEIQSGIDFVIRWRLFGASWRMGSI